MIAPKIIAITDPAYGDDHILRAVSAALAAAPPGEMAVELRDKVRAARDVFALAVALRELSTRYGAPLIVNDRLDLALAVGADGVHLGGGAVGIADARHLLGNAGWVSVAAHSIDDVARAEGEGADAALLSPIFATPGKGSPIGVEALKEARAHASCIALYALGGIDASNAQLCRAGGARGVAILRAVLDAADPAAEVRAILQALL